ncbi:MAG: bifunctional homocysteine S-methyltransferase/methylenetetrahydrofolate reductase [Gemmatimonadales bacterium]|nr:MAG: bifunctional homocysteine S-methyltransferase/methylenetetrahydrofolate reductase [Gemmatimonadales bacterium]
MRAPPGSTPPPGTPPPLPPPSVPGVSAASPSLRDLLADDAVHLMDGAMGTLLYDRGFFLNVCYDELSLTEPALVEAIHREYVEAGARILETNTFGANPVKLSSFGLEDQTEAINRAAVERARAAARAAGVPGILVLGAVGPLGIRIEPWGPTAEAEAEALFGRQVDGLLEGGVDGFLLETFQDPGELRQALRAVKARSSLPVMAQVTIDEGGRTAYGTDVEAVARKLEEWGADAVGVNCSVGPAEILEAVERMAEVTRLPLLAQPNAGFPRTVGDRKMYLASPEYMARYARRMVEAGVRFVGGCCGTTPEHIRKMAEALAEVGPKTGTKGTAGVDGEGGPPQRSAPGSDSPAIPEMQDPIPLRERSPLGRKLAEGTFVTSLELVPPRGWNAAGLLAEAREVRMAGVDLVTLPDVPRGLSRMAALPAALLVTRETGMEVLAHYTCRDRNMLGMISDLLGAAASGLRNVLVVSGDLSPMGPYPDHTTIFDIDSIGLTNVLARLNRGRDPGGHAMDPPTRFVVGVVLNQGAADREREQNRFHWKVEAGAEFAVTQPIFDPTALVSFLDEAAERTPSVGDLPILAGLWPLSSLRNAEFLANEVPGVSLPPAALERMREAEASGGPEGAASEGVRIAVEALEAVLPRIRGVHVSAPRGRVDLALRVIEEARALLRNTPSG